MHRTYYRPLGHVLADFAYYIEAYDLHKFHIADSEVNLPKEDHLITVCDTLAQTGLAEQQRWHGYFNIRPCSDRLIDALLRSRCYLPSFSVDSFDERMLKIHQKNFKLEHINVGVYHLGQGALDQARSHLETAQRLNAEFKPALAALDMLAQAEVNV